MPMLCLFNRIARAPITFACWFRARQSGNAMPFLGEARLARVGRAIRECAEGGRGSLLVGRLCQIPPATAAGIQ
jgi:hypothetical protein